MQRFEIGGGRVEDERLILPQTWGGYANAQWDDYHGMRRRHYPHRAPVTMALRARFSHGADALMGTAGFGFWNAPFGDPTAPVPTLPSATWFFFASAPSELPFLRGETGWFASTIDAGLMRSLLLVPLVMPVVLGNQIRPIFNKIWPPIERGLGISAEKISMPMTDWHNYRLEWRPTGCRFYVDNHLVHQTTVSPRRPLGFICWLDNQYLVATPQARFRAGTLKTKREQWLEVANMTVR